MDELVDKTVGRARELGHTMSLAGRAGELGHATALNLLPAAEDSADPAAEEMTLLVQSRILPTPTVAPDTDAKQTFPVKKKPPTLKQVNTARKHPRPKPTLPGPPRAASPASPLGSGLPAASQELRAPAEAVAGAGDAEQSPPELPWGGQATTSHPVLQISPSTLPPAVPGPFPDGAGDAGEAPTVAPASTAFNRTNGVESEVHSSASEESQETTTSTIITTTVITTEPTPGKPHCPHGAREHGNGVTAADGEQLCVRCQQHRLGLWGCLKPSALQRGWPLEQGPGCWVLGQREHPCVGGRCRVSCYPRAIPDTRSPQSSAA